MFRYDEWLSGILVSNAYHLSDFSQPMDLPIFEGQMFADAKVDVQDIDKAIDLQNIGFRLIDTNIQLTRARGSAGKINKSCRFATAADEDAVRKIAGNSFTQSRFHLDPKIPKEMANRIKSEWAGNFFNGLRGEWMVVIEDGNTVSGFLQLLKKTDEKIIIDLIAVSPDKQGKGFAREMIAFCLDNCLTVPPELIVGTQVSNFNSLKLYINMGFKISSAQYVFHLHQ